MKRLFICFLLSFSLFLYGQAQIIHVDEEAYPNYPFEKELISKIRNELSQNGTDASGPVDVFFDIDTTGQIVDVRIIRGISEYIDENFIKACIYKMPPWEPAIYKRHKIRSAVHVFIFV